MLPAGLRGPTSICICVEKKTAHNFGGKRSCTFETITMAPIQTKVCASYVSLTLHFRHGARLWDPQMDGGVGYMREKAFPLSQNRHLSMDLLFW